MYIHLHSRFPIYRDDPDHGMPELLSRSNSHNAAVFNDPIVLASLQQPRPGQPPSSSQGGIKSTVGATYSPSKSSMNKKLLPRLPPSPRLPPGGKKMLKKMKMGGDTKRNNNGLSGDSSIGSGYKPPLEHKRSSTSVF